MTEPTKRDLLLAAADLLERDGWTVAVLRNEAGQHCLLGALDAVCQSHRDLWPGVLNCIYTTPEVGYGGMSIWNDAPGRTAEEVIALLRRTAETCA